MIDHLDTFLRLIFPWESEYQQLYKSIMWKFPTTGQTQGQPLANYATQSLVDLKRLIQARISRPFHDVWICLATQRLVDTSKVTKPEGFPKAIRQLPNLVSLKSIWLDIDVKPDAYKTTAEAAMALYKFVGDVGLPRPTMIVKSGSGGLHVYWCTIENMTPDQWKPLAFGLRDAAAAKGLMIDPQVTANAAGVLRVPTSLNWKSGTPQPVQLMVTADESFPVYAMADLEAVLGSYVNVANMQTGTGAGPTGAAGQRSSNFGANVSSGQAAPVALDDVAAVCPLTADTLARGGAGDPEPLWSMMMLMASFTDDPIKDAHRLSSGDSRYTQAETDRKVQEKIMARAQQPSIGWPKCAQFMPLNPHCRTCPMAGQGKSPLNFITKGGNVHAPAAPAPGDTLVPLPYMRDINNHVWRSYHDPSTNSSVNIDLLGHEVIEACIDEDNNQLVFKTKIMGKEVWVQIPAGSCSQPVKVITALGHAPSGGINIPSADSRHPRVRDFVVSWITHLQAQRKTIVAAGYGWSDDMKGFTYADQTFTPTGVERSYQGKHFNPNFRKVGELKPWQDAMQLVYGKHALEIIVASSFAAPLTALLGTTSSVLSTYSAASGVGKSTAMQLAQSVWGHPVSGMSTLDDTVNSVKKKIADLKSLPAYWDELLTTDATDKVVNLVFSFTQGKAKSRLTQNSEQMDAPSFVTMFAIASNHGVGSKLYQDTSGTEAGGLRIFEVEAHPHAMTHTLSDANRLVGDLSMNFGAAGSLYAEKLVADRTHAEQVLKTVAKHFDAEFQFNQKERYWRATMVVIMAGAYLANSYGLTTFDLAGIKARLGTELGRQRARLVSKAHITMASPNAVLDLLTHLQTDLQGRHLVTTDIIPTTMGRVYNIQTIDTDVGRLQGVWMQAGANDGRFRIMAKKFDEWCREKKAGDPDKIINDLRQHYDIDVGNLTIGAGVPNVNTAGNKRSTCYDLTPRVIASASPPAGGHSGSGSNPQGTP